MQSPRFSRRGASALHSPMFFVGELSELSAALRLKDQLARALQQAESFEQLSVPMQKLLLQAESAFQGTP